MSRRPEAEHSSTAPHAADYAVVSWAALRVVVVLSALLLSSCHMRLVSPGQSPGSDEEYLYCSLLHVPSLSVQPLEERPFLGVSFEQKDAGQKMPSCKDAVFIHIIDVVKGTPAMDAGIEKGDFILAVDGHPLCDKADLKAAFLDEIASRKAGDKVSLDVMRDGKRLSLSAVLMKRPVAVMPEAAHDGPACDGSGRSLLSETLAENGEEDVFRKIIAGLNGESDAVHNMEWFRRGLFNPFELTEFTHLLRHPLSAGIVARDVSAGLDGPSSAGDMGIERAFGQSARLLDLGGQPASTGRRLDFFGFLRMIEDAAVKVEKALSGLTPEEKALLREKGIAPWEDDRWNEILALSLKVDRKAVFDALSPLISSLNRRSLAELREDVVRLFGDNRGPIWYDAMTPAGRVIVGGPGPNVYRDDAAVILDVGGNDLYLNNAGGTRPNIPVAIVVDWDGNDRYLTKENYTQGAGVFGGGFLLDLAGNDTLSCLDGCQGYGLFGEGLLYLGKGAASIKARSFSQGTGMMGAGVVIDEGGGDTYVSSLYGQGAGLFGGAGVLIDRAGDDRYFLGGAVEDFRDPGRSTVSMGQGFGDGIRPEASRDGISGGIGVLVDEAGDDTYVADYFAQGSAYYRGIGILRDLSGNDRYIAGRYAQGAGIHSAVGVLLDDAGDDSYYASFGVAQGMGHDFGVGYFEDRSGDDDMTGGLLVQGAATHGGVGLFLDPVGGDRHIFTEKGGGYAEDRGCAGIAITVSGYKGQGTAIGRAVLKMGMKSQD